MADVLLGADLGTSGLKLVALDVAGVVVAEAERAYAYDRPAPGWAEIDVRDLADGARRRAGRAGRRSWAAGRCAALGLSGQMHGAVLVDDAGARPAARRCCGPTAGRRRAGPVARAARRRRPGGAGQPAGRRA